MRVSSFMSGEDLPLDIRSEFDNNGIAYPPPPVSASHAKKKHYIISHRMYGRGYSKVARFIAMLYISGTKPHQTRRANKRRKLKLTSVNGVVVLGALLDDVAVYAVVAGSVAQPYPL